MSWKKPTDFLISRRTLAMRLPSALTALSVFGAPATASGAAATSPDLLDATLRGLALADNRDDPIAASMAQRALSQLEQTNPEAALLCRIYRKLDVRPALHYPYDGYASPAADENLQAIHQAIAISVPVTFGYTDLAQEKTSRTVLPLALVHPPQGVKLLAFCRLRDDYRQFFVRSMEDVQAGGTNFAKMRHALLRGLVDREGA